MSKKILTGNTIGLDKVLNVPQTSKFELDAIKERLDDLERNEFIQDVTAGVEKTFDIDLDNNQYVNLGIDANCIVRFNGGINGYRYYLVLQLSSDNLIVQFPNSQASQGDLDYIASGVNVVELVYVDSTYIVLNVSRQNG